MKTSRTRFRVSWVASAALLIAASAAIGDPVYPVKVSPNGRYFVDQNGVPVFWLGTTQWQLFRDYNKEEARLIIKKSSEHGFAFIQVMLVGVGDGTKTNVYGQKPWNNDNSLTPNEAYFENVDEIIRAAREINQIILMTIYHQTTRKRITMDNARAWAKWVAQRYQTVPNLVWCLVPEARTEFIPILRELAAGLHEGDAGAHLISLEPDPSPYSSSFVHGEPWLDFNSLQTWKNVELIYSMVTRDYKLEPVKPVLMAEGAYENGSEYGFEVTPLWIRRQAYYSYLCGGHHTYGHNDSWRVLSTWKKALDAPGALQMGVFKKVFLGRREWWKLVPDQALLTQGGKTTGQVLNLAARHADGRWAMVYLGDKAAFSIDMTKLAGKAKASWIDPRSGETMAAGAFENRDEQHFETPGGWEDTLLVLDAES